MPTPPPLFLTPFMLWGGATLPCAQSSVSAADTGQLDRASFRWGDFDGDGLDDVFVVRDSRGRLLRNEGGGALSDVTDAAGLSGIDGCALVLWEDVDGDADLDLYVGTLAGASRLFLSHGNGTFADATPTSGIDHTGEEVHAGFFDYDRDGAPDLFVRTRFEERLYHNLGGAVFEVVDLGFSQGSAGSVASATVGERPAVEEARVEAPATPPAAEDSPQPSTGRAEPRRTHALEARSVPPSAGPEPERATAFPSCARTIKDRSGGCLSADSTPTLGRLYPLSSTLFVSPSSRVGVNTTSPAWDLDVGGDAGVRGDLWFPAGLGGIRFPDVPTSSTPAPMLTMYEDDVTNADRMVVAHSTPFSRWGLRYDDTLEEFVFQKNDISPILQVGLLNTEIRSHNDLVLDDAELDLELDGASRARLGGDPNILGGAELRMTDVAGRTTVELDGDSAGDGHAFLVLNSWTSGPGFPANVTLDSEQAGFASFTSPGATDGIVLDARAGRTRIYANESSPTSTTPTLLVQSVSTAGGAYGVYAHMLSTSTGSFSAAVRGESGGTGGGGIGVYGSHAGNGYAVYGASFGSSGYGVVGAGDTAVWSAGDLVVSGTKSFVQPHPSDPALEIRFNALEGNESGTYFRGTAELAGGTATIDVPEAFRWASEPDGVTVQLTPRGPVLLWVESQDMERVVVRGERDIRFHYFVQGRRRGFDEEPVVTANRHFVPRFRGEPFGAQYPDELVDVLVANGTLKADRTPNEATADRLGWTLVERAVLEAQAEAERLAAQRRRDEWSERASVPEPARDGG